MTRHPVIPHPFLSPKSMFDVGIGEEQLKLKPEWQHLKGKENASADQRQASGTRSNEPGTHRALVRGR